MLDITLTEFKDVLRQGAKLEPERLWGRPTDNRAIMRDCMKGSWVHFKVNGQHRLVYMRGKQD